MIKTNNNKETYRGLTYEYMEDYILTHGTPEEIKKNLLAQLTAPVRWTQSVANMVNDGAGHFIEIGPGKVLQGLISKIAGADTVIEGYQEL